MNESITRAAGAEHGQETSPSRMIALINAAERVPKQRTTVYGEVDPAMTQRGLDASELTAITNKPAKKYERKRSHQLVKNLIAAG